MRDDWFIRGEVPMTKSEVRAVSLSKLEMGKGAVLLDIGAGTGSVSVEAAICHRVEKVYAIEKNEEALKLFTENRKKAGLSKEQVTLIAGVAPGAFPECFEKMPTHAFIGGSSGNMERILDCLLEINDSMRIVINVIALETMAEVLRLLAERGIEGEIVSVQVARAKTAGTCHLMQGQNPVYIITLGGKDGKEHSPAAICGA